MKLSTKIIIFLLFLFGAIYSQEINVTAKDAILKHKKSIANRFSSFKKMNVLQGDFDSRYYRIELNIKYFQKRIEGKVSARFTSLVDSLNAITLDLDWKMGVISVSGDAVGFRREEQTIIINLDKNYAVNEDVFVVVEYAGEPGNEGIFNFDLMPGENTLMASTLSEPYGASYWWPCKDRPSDKADSVDMFITVPENQIAASNGVLISEILNGDGSKTFHWHEQYPIATYLVSLIAGTYHHFTRYYHYGNNDSLLLDYYVYPNRAEAADTVFSTVPDHIKALSHFFGPYPFIKEKYGLAQFNWSGGMEHQTLTSIGFVSPSMEYLYVHELGHQWFGDQVTCASWKDIWLNEGFASYSEPLYAEWAGFAGYPPGMEAYHAYIGTQKYFKDGTIIREDTLNISSLFDRIVYDKGSWVLHMLRHITGDEVFFDILKSYVSDIRWTYGSVRTPDFIDVCEQKSGLNLKNYFDQWLNYPYYPKYEYGWRAEKNNQGSYNVEVMIAQMQTAPIYEMPVDLTFKFLSGPDTTIKVINNNSKTVYSFTLLNKPNLVVFDEEDWILKMVEELPYGKNSIELAIDEIYPTPFYNSTTIKVINWTHQRHKLHIYDSLGRKIRTISDYKALNHYSFLSVWDGKNDKGDKVASGIFFIRPFTSYKGVDKFGITKKVIYLK